MKDSSVTPIILCNSLGIVRGGRTKAVLTRANTLAKVFEKVYIVTLSFQQNHTQIITQLYEEGFLDKKVDVLNFFKSFNTNKRKKIKTKNNTKFSVKQKGLIEIKDFNQKKNPSFRYYKNGIYVLYKRFDYRGNLHFIDYMDESRHRIKREEYDEDGLLVRTRHMDKHSNTPRLDRYFNDKEECCLTVWVNPKTKKEGSAIKFTDTPKEYKSLNDLKKEWIEKSIRYVKYPVLMTDERELDKLNLSIKHKSLKRIAVIHSNHLKKPYNNSAEIRPSYKTLFDNIKSFHHVVFLTREQKEDVERRFGTHGSFPVIAHPAKQVNLKSNNKYVEEHSSYLAISMTRYDKSKRLDEAISAFKIVVDKIPWAEYHIYGFGKERRYLNQLIKSLGLEENVKLIGYTYNVSYTYSMAACSILTSDFEGFGMVLTESLAYGTPVVSYDTKYGPNDIIKHGVDGYLVEKGNQRQLAEYIIKIMEDKKLRKELSKNAIQVNSRFSVESYTKRWKDVLLN